MRKFTLVLASAAALVALPAASANAWCQAEVCTNPVGHAQKQVDGVLDKLPQQRSAGPDICQAEPCTDPVGHLTKPVQPIIGDLLTPQP